MNEPILCYVDPPWAYFTTTPLAAVWADDWDDAGYEHNAGPPHTAALVVAYTGDLVTPDAGHSNSPYSVAAINAGAVPWLRSSEWHRGPPVVIPAGTPLGRFIELVRQAGGQVYREVES